MAAELAAILGDTLLSGDASVNVGDRLAGKKVCLLYFSAHWCPPCRSFTPTLVEAYEAYKATGGGEAEVVFVSRDKNLGSFKDYFQEMPWLAIPFEGTEKIREELGPKFGVRGIPALVALGPDGVQIFGKDDGIDLRSLVGQHKGAAFPMTREHVKELKAEQERRAKKVLAELCADFPLIHSPKEDTFKVSLAELLDGCEHLALVFGDGDSDDGSYRKVAEVQTKINQGSSSKAGKECLSVLYLGWTLYNDSCDHDPFGKMFFSVPGPPDGLKKKLEMLFDAGVRPPHVLLLRRDDESGLPVIVLSDPEARRIGEFGAEGYPWTDARVAELKAIQAARVEALKEKQVNLQFLKGIDGRDGVSANDGKEVKVDALAAMSSDCVIGLYFSAHWCPPCRGFTPELAKCYSELKRSGKSFEIVFLSSDKDEASFKEYFAEMPWIAVPFAERQLKGDLSSIFEVRGIPTLVLLKPDGTLITTDGCEAVGYGPEYFPWGPDEMKRGTADAKRKAANAKEEALKAEEAALEEQRAKGAPLLKRLRGRPGVSFEHDSAAFTFRLKEFATLGAPEMLKTDGVLYYEVKILESEGIPQFGFASGLFAEGNDQTGDGVGDDADSWGFDGVRGLRWHDGDSPWAEKWATGDVIGFAANIDAGKIAVSKNGSWSEAPNGVVFEGEKIKGGVYPAMTGQGYNARYNLDGKTHGPFTHGPPPEEVWASAAP